MTPDEHGLDLQIEVAATPEQVWEAISTGPGISAWFMPAEVDGERITFHHMAGGSSEAEVTDAEAPRRLRFTEGDGAQATEFLVEARSYGTGLVAVAPYDTNGFRSPDWTGFQFESSDKQPKAYPGLPGTWSGVPYDFVEGGAGLQIPGLPNEVVGCVSGT